MTRQFSTSAKPLGYYTTVATHIEQIFGSHFEQMERFEQFTLLSSLAIFMANHANEENPEYGLYDAYMDAPGGCFEEVENILPEIEQCPDETLLGLCEALVINLRTTKEVNQS